MSEINKKRCRKDKLIPRDDDLILGEHSHDESIRAVEFLQDQPTVSLDKIKDKISNEVSYESSSDRQSRFSIEIEVEKADEFNETDHLHREPTDTELTEDEIDRILGQSNNFKPLIFHPGTLANELSKALAKPSNFVERKIEVEIRNQWVRHLNIPKQSKHELLIQQALYEWRTWACQSRNIRTTVFAYKCLICSIGWWYLEPFREHIKSHDDVKLSLSSIENSREASIVASQGEWVDSMCKVDIEGKCYRCLKTYQMHGIGKNKYSCVGCRLKLGTCAALFKHEGLCYKYQKMTFKREIPHESFYKCDICEILCLTKSRYEDHMKYFHIVRSDMFITPDVQLPKTCTFCNKKYFIYTTHICSGRMQMVKCPDCFRTFQNKFLLHMHKMFTKPVNCNVCNKHLPSQCMELEHYIQHSKKYTMMISCAHCRDYVLFFNSSGFFRHGCASHSTKQKKKDITSMTIVPIMSLTLDFPAAGLTMQDMIEPRDPQDEIPVYPLGYDAAFDNLRREMMNERDSITQKTSTKTREREKEDFNEANCSGDLQMDEIDIKAEIVTHGDVLQDLIDYDNIDDDRIEEDEIEIQKFIEKNIAIKQEQASPTREYSSDDDSPLMMIDSEFINEAPTEVNLHIAKKERISIDEENIQEQLKQEQKGCLKQERISIDNDEAVDNKMSNKDVLILDQETKPDVKDAIDRNEKIVCSNRAVETIKIKQEKVYHDDSDELEIYEPIEDKKNSEIDKVMTIKKETDSDNLSKVFQSSKDFASVLNKSEKLVIDSEKIKEEFVVKDEPMDEDSDLDDIIVLNADDEEEEKSPEVSDYKETRKKPRIKTKLYSCKRCKFSGIHSDYQYHKSTCRKSRLKTSNQTRIYKAYKTITSCPCTKCGMDFDNVRSYVQHLPEHGLADQKCPVCFHRIPALASHLMQHVKHSFLKLQILDETANMCTSRMNGLHQCKSCTEKVVFEDFFKHWESHFELKRPDERDDVEERMEIIETNDFSLKPEEIKILLEQVSTPSGFVCRKCVLCGREFNRRHDVKRHCIEHLMQSAIALNPYKNLKCQHCPMVFDKPDQFKDHLRTVAALPVFKCEMCNKNFSDSSNFAKHKKVHNVKILICDICNKKFASRYGLEKHIQLHATIEPVFCRECDQTFYSESALRKHNKTRHNKGAQRFHCKICRKKFTCLKDTWDHLWDFHKERKFKADCPLCNQSFRKYQDVKAHVKTVHGKERVGQITRPNSVRPSRKSGKVYKKKNDTRTVSMINIDEFLKNTKVVELDDSDQETWVLYDED